MRIFCVLYVGPLRNAGTCPARAFYDKARAAGDTHAQALRKPAKRWLKNIHPMWINHEPYNNGKYLESLINRGGPPPEYMRS